MFFILLNFLIGMGIVDALIPETIADPENLNVNGSDVEDIGQRVDDMFMKVDQVCIIIHRLQVLISL